MAAARDNFLISVGGCLNAAHDYFEDVPVWMLKKLKIYVYIYIYIYLFKSHSHIVALRWFIKRLGYSRRRKVSPQY